MTPTPPDAVDGLHEIALPPAVPWTPSTPAWIALGLIVLAALIALAVRLRARWRAAAYRRAALRELDAIEARLGEPTARAHALADLAALLKRVALAAFPRTRVAPLTDRPWLEFLDSTVAGGGFASRGGRALVAATYDPSRAAELDADDRRAMIAAARRFIRGHRREVTP